MNNIQDLSIQDLKMKGISEESHQVGCENNHHGVCAICLNKIVLQETALVKGENRKEKKKKKRKCSPYHFLPKIYSLVHPPTPRGWWWYGGVMIFCVTCILRWATYKEKPTCPQCKHPFEFLYIHRSLDGSIQDYMFEESVCLLLRATWFKPLIVEEKLEVNDEMDHLYAYAYEDDEELEDFYYTSSPSLRIGNRRWGDNGYVRAGRQEARPAHRPNSQDLGAGSSSRQAKKKDAAAGPKETVGRRAKRALKREAADKAAAEKHQQHLVRLGRI